MKKLITLITVLCLLFAIGTCALAEGDGTGGGGGNGEGPALKESSVADGSADVPVDSEIVLKFTKNVVNSSCKENNLQCFSLKDSAGSEAELEVIMGDDQADPSVKQIITLKPAELVPGETYTLTISGELKAKNGSSMGEDTVLTFTTAGDADTPMLISENPADEPAAAEEAAAEPAADEPAAAEEAAADEPAAEPAADAAAAEEPSEESAAQEAEPAAAASEQSQKTGPALSVGSIIGIVVVLAVAVALIAGRTRKKK